MPRTAQSSLWVMPLVAGADTVSRTDSSLVSAPPDLLVGHLPATPPWLLAGCKLWLDGHAHSTVKTFPDGTIYRWISRVGDGNFGSAPTALTRPSVDGDSVSFEEP